MADPIFTIDGEVKLAADSKSNVLKEIQDIITEAEKKSITLKVNTVSNGNTTSSTRNSGSANSNSSSNSSSNSNSNNNSNKILLKNLTQYNKLQTAIKTTEAYVKKLDNAISAANKNGVSGIDNQIRRLTSAKNASKKYLDNLNKIQKSYTISNKNGVSRLDRAKLSSALMSDAEKANIASWSVATKKIRDDYTVDLATVTAKINEESGKILKPSAVSNLFSSVKEQIKRSIGTAVAGFAISTVKSLITTNVELGASFADLQIVTNATNMELANYKNTISSIAEETAISIKDLTEATTTYARLGYSAEESMNFAKYTAMLQNVGDVDATTAQNAVTAIVKAYNIGYDEIEDVMDKLVLVGNNFPISPSDLAEGMNNAGSMLSVATGGNFEQSLALLTAANTTIQNISKSSTGLRTIAARIRNVESELNDLGEEMTTVEYEELTKTLTNNAVSMTDETGTIRNLYDILKDISDQWVTLGENEKAALAKALAGTRQQNVFFSLMENFNEATGAMDAMQNSTGTLETSYAHYLDTVSAHLATLKSQFESLSLNAVDSGLLNTFIDLGTALVKTTGFATKLVNTLGGLPTILGAISSISLLKRGNDSAIIKGFLKLFGSGGSNGNGAGIFRNGGAISRTFSSLKLGLTSVWGSLKNGFKSIKSGTKSVQELGNAAQSAGKSAQGMGSSFKISASSIVGAITAAVTLVVAAISLIKNSIAQARQNRITAGEEVLSDIQSISEAANSYNEVIQKYKEGAASSEELSSAQKELRIALGLTSTEFDNAAASAGNFNKTISNTMLESLKTMQSYLPDIAKEASEQMDTGLFSHMSPNVSGGADYAKIQHGSVAKILELFQSTSASINADAIKQIKNEYVAASQFYADENDVQFLDLDELFGYNLEDASTWKQGLDNFKVFLEDYAKEYGTVGEDYATLLTAYSSFASATKDYFNEVTKVNEEVVETAILSEGGTVSTLDAYKEKRDAILLKLLTDENYTSLFSEDAGETPEEVLGRILQESSLYSEWEKALQEQEESVKNIADKKKEIARELSKAEKSTFSQVDSLMSGLSDEEIAELYIAVTTDGITDIDELKKRIEDLRNSKDSVDVVTDGFKILKDSVTAAQQAVTDLEEVLSADDYDEGYENRKKYLEEMKEELEKGYIGSKAMDAYKTYFGIEGTADDVQSFIAKVSSWFEDGTTGIQNFFAATNASVDEGIAHWDEATGKLNFDYTRIDEWAEALGVPVEMIEDFIQQLHMYSEDFNIMSSTLEQLSFFKNSGGVTQLGSSEFFIADMEKLRTLTSLSTEEVQKLNEEIEGAEGVKLIEIEVNTPNVDAAKQQFDTLYSALDSYSIDIEQKAAFIADYITGLSNLHPEVAIDLLTQLELPADLAGQIYGLLPDAIQTQISLTDNGFAKKAASAKDEVENLDDSTASPTITANTADFYTRAQAVRDELNAIDGITASPHINLITSLGFGKDETSDETDTQKKAIGTHGSTGGLTLLGDEPSPSGKPKPELVVSNGEAYLAGQNGAEVKNLRPGDVVYPYSKTKQILGSGTFKGSIPALASGLGTNDAIREKIRVQNTKTTKTSTITVKVDNSYSGGTPSGISYYSGSSSGSSGSSSGSSGSSSGSSGSSSEDEETWFDKLYKKHQHLLSMEKESDKDYYTWLASAWQKAYKEGILTEEESWKYEEEVYKWKKEQMENLFKTEYELHNHKVDLTKESDQDYYTWLSNRVQTAYANNEISLSDYYKYVEEIYKKGKELINDYFNDLENLTSMFEKAGKSNSDIISFDEMGMRYAEEQIAKLIKEGKDNNDDEIQELQSTWWKFYEDKADREEEVADEARDELESLIDFRIDMIKKELDKEKEAIDKRLENLKDFYDKQKELLQKNADDEDYLKDQSEKRKAVSDIQAKLDQLELDNSAAAQKRKLELLEELQDAQEELDEFEKDHALDSLQEHLDKMQEMQEAELNKEIENIEAKEENAKELRNQALEDIRNGNQELFDEMIKYNDEFGDGNDFTVTKMWNAAYTALLRYKELYNEYYEGVKLTTGEDTLKKVDTSKIDAGNKTPTKPTISTVGDATVKEGEKEVEKIKSSLEALNKSTSSSSTSSSSTITAGKWVKLKSSYAASAGGSYISNPYYGVGSGLYVVQPPGLSFPYKVNGTDWVFLSTKSTYSAANGVGWIKVSDLEGYASGTAFATAGLHEINEQGDEALFKSKNGNTYRLFSGGEKVFSADATNFLYKFANNGADLLQKMSSSTLPDSGSIKSISPVFNMGNIIINGNTDKETLSELRRRRRDEIDYVLKEFNKLNK